MRSAFETEHTNERAALAAERTKFKEDSTAAEAAAAQRHRELLAEPEKLVAAAKASIAETERAIAAGKETLSGLEAQIGAAKVLHGEWLAKVAEAQAAHEHVTGLIDGAVTAIEDASKRERRGR
jgi:hypothetical protein